MKKLCVSIGLALVFCLVALSGCSFADLQEETAKGPAGPSLSENEPWESDQRQESGDPQQGNDAKEEEAPGKDQDPAASLLAVLDTIDVSKAFGNSGAEGWSFAMNAAGDLNAAYGFRLVSEISGDEKTDLEYGAGIGLDDLFGIRSNAQSALGVDLFGGGKASLSLRYRGPHEDSAPSVKTFDVGFRHDGDFIWYAGEGEEESQTSLSGLKEKLENAAMTETFQRMEEAFTVIPEELSKGASLRFAVEKLIDLGFTVEIDDTDGVTVSVKANGGFYTDLLNDLLEQFLPAKWLAYIPRADFRYEKTVFDIKLSFDREGYFREYSMTSDVSLTSSLEVRDLFLSESRFKVGGGLSFTAYHGEIPGYGADE